MQRKWVLVAAGIAIVAGLLVGGQALLNQASVDGATGSGQGAGSTSQPTTPAGEATRAADTGPRQPPPQKLTPITATRPAAEDAPLHPLRVSPPRVISGYSAGRLPHGTAYTITFRPWGYGPGGRHGPNVVATILSAVPIGAAPDPASLEGGTLLLVMDERGGTVYVGGVHTATLTFIEDDKLLFPTLTAVKGLAP